MFAFRLLFLNSRTKIPKLFIFIFIFVNFN